MPLPNKKAKQNKIIWKQWRGRAPIPPWLLYLAGILVSLVGTGILALGFGVLPITHSGPRLLLILFGCYLLFFGLVLFLLALEPRIRRSKLSDASPYQSDYPWSPAGIDADAETPLKKSILGALVLGGILPPLYLIAWNLTAGDGTFSRVLLFAFLGLFDLVLLTYVQQLASFGWQRLRFGKTRVLFDRFPFLVGQDLAVTFQGGPQLQNRWLLATLRCVEERTGGSSSIVSYQRFAAKSQFTTGPAGRTPISFPLPPDAPATALNRDLPIRWELIIEAVAPGPGYKGVFLMPVYSPARPITANQED